MKNCPQTTNQSVYEHCISVYDHLFDLIGVLENKTPKYNWKLPNWFVENKQLIIDSLLSHDILAEYTKFHDIGKVFCRVVDAEGKQHFPDHAKVSEKVWLEYGGSVQVGKLIGMDMDIHQLKAVDIAEFTSRPEAVSLLLAGLSEVHSNSQLFGGIESISFKIKYKQIDKRGQAIINLLKAKKV